MGNRAATKISKKKIKINNP